MASNYGAFSESAYPKDNNAGAYQESRKVVFSATPRKRTKASDTGSMNSLYKPKASPGPIGSAANVREGRSSDRTPKPNRANAREGRPAMAKATRPMRESTGSTKSTPRPKSNSLADQFARNLTKGLKKAYQGK